MKKRIIFYIMSITLLALIIFFIAGLRVVKNMNIKAAEDTVRAYTKMYATYYTDGSVTPEKYVDDIRITIIADDGKVIYDTRPIDIASMENHLEREEVKAAIADSPRTFVRHSDTLGTDLIYYAIKANQGGKQQIIRASIPVEGVEAYMYRSLPIFILILLAVLALSALLAAKMSGKILEPLKIVKMSLQSINNGGYVKELPTSDYDEINQMLIGIDDISKKLKINMKEITEEKKKLDFIINNITDGIFAIDSNMEIKLINTSAKKSFGVSDQILGRDIRCMTYNNDILENIKNCRTQKLPIITENQIGSNIYQITCKNLEQGWNDDSTGDLAVVILNDITNIKNNEKLRSEFFANASHELKTPLTSIIGFDELMKINNNDQKLVKYIEQIEKESHRMSNLIDDMLRLSELENIKSTENIDISLDKVAKEVQNLLEPIAKPDNITISIHGTGSVKAEYKHIYQLIKNITENAVKYNVKNGTVDIYINKTFDGRTVLEITDSGIGIDETSQKRVFERFYRVEKSRSRATGGTGLGLAIVKHICELYKAEISIESKLRQGTKITVKFPI